MSTAYQGVNYAKTQQAVFEAIDQGQYNCPLMKILDQFVLTADLAANDTILVGGPIPEGAVILNAKVAVPVGLSNSAAIDFGYQAIAELGIPSTGSPADNVQQATDLTAFFGPLVVTSATWASAFGGTTQGDFYTQMPITSQVQAIATCTVASSGATGKSIYFEVEYALSGV